MESYLHLSNFTNLPYWIQNLSLEIDMSADSATSGGQPKESQSSKGGPKVILLLGQSFNVPNFENMLDKEKEVALTAWLKNNVKDGLVTSTKHSVGQKVEPMDAQSASIKLPHNSTQPTQHLTQLILRVKIDAVTVLCFEFRSLFWV